jgi:hypothetical protein
MGNEIEKKKANNNSLVQRSAFGVYGAAANSRPFDGDLLLFNKGDYLGGLDKEDIPIGNRFYALMDGLQVGWVRWDDHIAIDHRMGFVIDGFQPERRSDLGDTDTAL